MLQCMLNVLTIFFCYFAEIISVPFILLIKCLLVLNGEIVLDKLKFNVVFSLKEKLQPGYAETAPLGVIL